MLLLIFISHYQPNPPSRHGKTRPVLTPDGRIISTLAFCRGFEVLLLIFISHYQPNPPSRHGKTRPVLTPDGRIISTLAFCRGFEVLLLIFISHYQPNPPSRHWQVPPVRRKHLGGVITAVLHCYDLILAADSVTTGLLSHIQTLIRSF